MCDAVEYFLGGERKTSYFSTPNAELPVVHRGGAISFYRWGALGAAYIARDNIAGWGAKFPETGWALLEEIRAGKWTWLEPKAVRILCSRFVRVDAWQVPRYFELKPRQFIQGLLAHINPYHKRVYVVTVPAPPSYAHGWPDWPRIVGNSPIG
jgi:hypothetical protein